MAELGAPLPTHTGLRLGSAQFAAIAWLRWRILANGFRRKGGTAELIGRILLLPLLAALVLTPAVAAGFFSWSLATRGALAQLPFVLWAAFFLTQLLNINLGQPGTTFDPTELIRFPLTLRHYVLVRLCFGLLSPANVVVTCLSLAVFVGITLAQPRLWLWTLPATAAFALANVLFSRMIFAWIDRWLSTRRAREVFTGLIFAASLGVQFLNVNYNPGFQHGHRRPAPSAHSLHRAQALLHSVQPSLRWLPPELTGAALVAAQRGQAPAALGNLGLILAFAALFLLIYALRMRTEYRGENLSDQANAVRPAPQPPAANAPPRGEPLGDSPPVLNSPVLNSPVLNSPDLNSPDLNSPVLNPSPRSLLSRTLLPRTLAPLLGKELLVLRRNTGLLYGVIAPTVMVFLFAGRLSLRGGSHWLLLLAVGYALLGLAPISYNSFGLEGAGAQFYFMAPVPLRDVFFAKNVMQFLLAAFEVVTVLAIVSYVAGRPHLPDVVFVLLWAVASLLLNTTLGNLRSISAPKKIDPGRTLNRAQSQVSAWIALGMLLACSAIGAGLQFVVTYLRSPWLGVAVMAALAFGAFVAYEHGLRGMEAYTLDRRDEFFEELGKKI